MTRDGSLRRVRSWEPITDEHLLRLADLATAHHCRFAEAHPVWAEHRLAACLVQGAARHRVHADRGVKDLDLYIFYALPSGCSGGEFPWNRHLVHTDFGPSSLGREAYTADQYDTPSVAARIPTWEGFAGRRVDLMARAIAAHDDGPLAALRAWLERGTRRPGSTPWHLARTPVVCLAPDLGDVWWTGPEVDEPGREKGVRR